MSNSKFVDSDTADDNVVSRTLYFIEMGYRPSVAYAKASKRTPLNAADFDAAFMRVAEALNQKNRPTT